MVSHPGATMAQWDSARDATYGPGPKVAPIAAPATTSGYGLAAFLTGPCPTRRSTRWRPGTSPARHSALVAWNVGYASGATPRRSKCITRTTRGRSTSLGSARSTTRRSTYLGWASGRETSPWNISTFQNILTGTFSAHANTLRPRGTA